ncbi:hypothetical protein [Acaryochloris sp. IP29b_bin.137]|nr:hypothetical protein [Acaryochloris sp. IP29b_bin.137]
MSSTVLGDPHSHLRDKRAHPPSERLEIDPCYREIIFGLQWHRTF